jgi:hypothetical protein
MKYLLVLLSILWALPLSAQEARPPVHIEIVLDSSGSMLDNDPGRLSSLAGMIFADLAAPDDLVGVQSMKKQGYTLQRLAPVSEVRAKARQEIGKLPFHGVTDCAGPLKIAADELKKAKTGTSRQFVVFLSDGVCPRERPDQEQALLSAAESLRLQGVRVFSIGLFDEAATEGKDPERDLKTLASATNGEYFRAEKAADLPLRFAEILGRIVGSEAQPFALEPGKATTVELDGYVADASVIVTSTKRAVRVTRALAPDGVVLPVPLKTPPFEASESAFFESAGTNSKGAHYVVLRLIAPKSGAWSFVVDAPADANALVIQNYALIPELEVASSLRKGEPANLTMRLKGPDGKPVTDAKFLAKVVASIQITRPDGSTERLALTAQPDGALVGEITPALDGTWKFVGNVALKTGGLKKSTAEVSAEVLDLKLAFGAAQKPIDLGEIKAGEKSSGQSLDLSASKMGGPYKVDVTIDLAGVAVTPAELGLTPEKLKFDVVFEVDINHSGGPVKGLLKVGKGGASIEIPVIATVMPLTFWEKHGKLVIAILSALGLLLLMLFLAKGFLGPHSFSPEARINWGESMDRLNKNALVIREIRGTGSGFYRNAKLVFGGPTSFAPADGSPLVTIEAVGPNRMEIRAESGVELLSVNKFDQEKTKKVEDGTCPISTGEIYKVGQFFLRVR